MPRLIYKNSYKAISPNIATINAYKNIHYTPLLAIIVHIYFKMSMR